MSGIAGNCTFEYTFTERADEQTRLLADMCDALIKRGGASRGEWLGTYCGLTINGDVPYTWTAGGETAAVVLDGEIYNRDTLWADMPGLTAERAKGGDAALVLLGLTEYGFEFVNRLEGVYAFAIWYGGVLYVYRDRAGVKPVFYTSVNGVFLFASEIKALFTYPGVQARLDTDGMLAMLAVSPAREEHSGVFKDINALPPGCFLTVCAPRDGMNTPHVTSRCYWDLPDCYHSDGEAETVARVRSLLAEAIVRQTAVCDETCAFLSGGVDSSIVTAIAAGLFQQAGKKLNSYSFDFTNSGSHFTANAYQPDRDRPWVEKMAAFSKTNHRYIECGPEDLISLLGDAVVARDLPGMADIDASLLYFCKQIPKGSVALTGECADEVFGGYPWFHREELINNGTFPWSGDIAARKTLFSNEWLDTLHFDERQGEFYRRAYQKALKNNASVDPSSEEGRLRAINYLTIKWFMTTLTERMDRIGAQAGINARVPFADTALMEYVWTTPWKHKRKNGEVKYLLREAARGLLPDEVLFRKKSPFPKTYDPVYTALVADRVREDILNDPNAPVRDYIDAAQVRMFIDAPANVSRPWFGQLMAGPQRLAWLWQLNYWLKTYRVRIEF